MLFAFFRLRFHLRAIQPVRFPAVVPGNVLRGGFGKALREVAPAEVYGRIFQPHAGSGPSGLADPPRPFVFRAAHLDGAVIAAGNDFHFDVHLFQIAHPPLDWFVRAIERLAGQGVGRGRARLLSVEQLDLAGRPAPCAPLGPPCALALNGAGESAGRVLVRLLTPTELKSAGELAAIPEFRVLFARVRDRLSALAALYGGAPLAADYRGLGERAAAVRLVRSEIRACQAERRSGRTGQVHPLGGFTGEAEYEGRLGEFLPWLRAAYWTGVGRQTVWGKGVIETNVR